MLEKSIVKAAAQGRWETIFSQLAPVLRDAMERSPRHAAVCPMPNHAGNHARNYSGKRSGSLGNQGSHGSYGRREYKFRLPRDFREYGNGICTCGAWGDGFGLLMALNGWSFPETLEKVAGVLGLADDRVRVVNVMNVVNVKNVERGSYKDSAATSTSTSTSTLALTSSPESHADSAGGREKKMEQDKGKEKEKEKGKEKKKEKEKGAETGIGTVTWIGTLPVRFAGKTYQVFSLRLKRDGNEGTEEPEEPEEPELLFSGSLLRQACAAAGVHVGDRAEIELRGIQTCTCEKGVFKRKIFRVAKLPTLQSLQSLPSLAEAQASERRRREEIEKHRARLLRIWEKAERLGSGLGSSLSSGLSLKPNSNSKPNPSSCLGRESNDSNPSNPSTSAHDDVIRYFSGRGIGALVLGEGMPPTQTQTQAQTQTQDFAKDLRAASGLKTSGADSSGTTTWNGLLAAVRDLQGNIRTLHRTLIRDGKKADVAAPKTLMRLAPGDTISGCAVHLGEPDEADGVLCLAEGIETAASVVIGTGYPCWSCISANGLKTVLLPDAARIVFIFEDKDSNQTGQKAAAALRARLEAEGRLAVVCSISADIPEGMHGIDWNDVLRSRDGMLRFPVRKPMDPTNVEKANP